MNTFKQEIQQQQATVDILGKVTYLCHPCPIDLKSLFLLFPIVIRLRMLSRLPKAIHLSKAWIPRGRADFPTFSVGKLVSLACLLVGQLHNT